MRISGVVVEGSKRGKRLGFPTLNVSVDGSAPEGIYISRTEINARLYNSLTFIGAAKTYGDTTYQSETYVFDFNEDIYGQTIIVLLLKKIRENEMFPSEEKLLEQMEKDKKLAIEYFKSEV